MICRSISESFQRYPISTTVLATLSAIITTCIVVVMIAKNIFSKTNTSNQQNNNTQYKLIFNTN
jgi:hypothetical protein